MEKLRATIAQYSRWKELEPYIDRIEGHFESDFSLTVENAKALLESIAKEICTIHTVDLGNSPSINNVLKKAFIALGYSNNNMVNKVSGSLANIGQELGNLRNEISPTSHGKSLNELRERNNKVDLLTRDFLIDSTLIVASFLIRSFEERRSLVVISEEEKIVGSSFAKYEESEDFNTFLDDMYGEFNMGDYSYTASEILFNVDYKAYVAELQAFNERDQEVDMENNNEPYD